MAVTITTDQVTLYDGNVAFGGGTVYSGFQRFGTGCNGVQVSNTTTHYTGTVTSFSLVGRTIYSWMVGPGSIGTIGVGGYRIVIGDGTNTRAYYVGGSDYKSFNSQGWQCLVLNGDNLPTAFAQLAGTLQPNLSAITLVGVGFTTTSKAVGNSPNCFYDIARVGTGITIAGGTTGARGKFSEIVAAEDSISSGAWGVVESLGGNLYGIQGRVTFGSTTAASYFQDANAVVYFEDRTVGNTFYQFNVQGSSGHVNEFILGEKVGTGDTAVGGNGVSILGSRPYLVNFGGTNVNVLNMYGGTISGAGTGITLSTNSAHEFIGVTVQESGKVTANQAVIRNCFFNATTDNTFNGSALLWNGTINIKNSNFNGNAHGTGNPAGVEHPTAGTFTYDNLKFSGNDIDVRNTSGGAVTINAVNGSNPTTSTGTTTIVNTQLFRVTGLVPGSEVRVYRKSDGVELAGVENSSTVFEYAYGYTGDIDVDVYIHNIQYVWIGISSTLTANGVTIPVQQRFDRNYSNPV